MVHRLDRVATKLRGECITMQTGQFVIGIFDGSTETYQTLNVEKFLSPDEFDKLWNRQTIGVWYYTNQEESVVAKCTITPTTDGAFMGRKGVINHTVIAKFDSTTTKDGATYQIDPLSITLKLAHTTKILNATFPKNLKQPLDLPEVP